MKLKKLKFRVISVSDILHRLVPGPHGLKCGFLVTGETTGNNELAGRQTFRQAFVVPVFPDYYCDPADPTLEAYSPVWRRSIVVEPGAVLDAVSGGQITMPDGQTAILIERIRIGYDLTFRVVSVSDIQRLIPGPYGLESGFVVTGEDQQTFVVPRDYFCDPADPELEAYCSVLDCSVVVEPGAVLDAFSGKQIIMPDGQVAVLLDRIRINEKYACSITHM